MTGGNSTWRYTAPLKESSIHNFRYISPLTLLLWLRACYTLRVLELAAKWGKKFLRRPFRSFRYLRYKIDPVRTVLGSSSLTGAILGTSDIREIFRSLDTFCVA